MYFVIRDHVLRDPRSCTGDPCPCIRDVRSWSSDPGSCVSDPRPSRDSRSFARCYRRLPRLFALTTCSSFCVTSVKTFAASSRISSSSVAFARLRFSATRMTRAAVPRGAASLARWRRRCSRCWRASPGVKCVVVISARQAVRHSGAGAGDRKLRRHDGRRPSRAILTPPLSLACQASLTVAGFGTRAKAAAGPPQSISRRRPRRRALRLGRGNLGGRQLGCRFGI